MKFSELRKKLKKDRNQSPKEYFQNDTIFRAEISNLITGLRISRGMTQEQLAVLIGTQQSGIARVESGKVLPTIELLKRISDACDVYLSISFIEDDSSVVTASGSMIHEPSSSHGIPSPYVLSATENDNSFKFK